MAVTTTTQQSNPFVKQLASSDRRVRDRALSALRTYLHRTAQIPPAECLKLWKGLYYCMWMSDKPRTQQQLARDLADLLNVCTPENFLNIADAFWKTMAREWSSIDALRMDKYLYLVRCYVQEGFQYLRRKKWDDGLVEKYLDVLGGVPFEPRDVRILNGLRYHVIDLYVDELDKADEKGEAPVEELMKPMRKLAKESVTKTVRTRAAEALKDRRLGNWKGRRELGDESDDDEMEEEDGASAKGTAAGGANVADEDDDFGGFDD